MSYSTEFNFELTENEFSVEHEEALVQMQLHDVIEIKLPLKGEPIMNPTGILIIRVPNGYMYSVNNTLPVFVPEYKHSRKPIKSNPI